jgi:hypothetical protein
MNRLIAASCVVVQSSSCSLLQKSRRRVRAFPQAKLSVCHFSSVCFISCGDPIPDRIVITPGMGLALRYLMYTITFWISSMNSAPRARQTSFEPLTTSALTRLSPMTAPPPSRLALERPCSMEAVKTRFSPARPIDATWAKGWLSSSRISVAVSSDPFPFKWAASRISTLSLWIQM